MAARNKAKATKRSAKRPRVTTLTRAKRPTKAQLAARDRIIAESGVTVTDEMVAEIDREIRELLSR